MRSLLFSITRFRFFRIGVVGFFLWLGMECRAAGDVLARSFSLLGLLELEFGHFHLTRSRSIDIQTIHDLVDFTIVDSVGNFPHRIPILSLNFFCFDRVINDHTPFGQVTNVQVLRSNVAANIINNKVFGCDSKRVSECRGNQFFGSPLLSCNLQ